MSKEQSTIRTQIGNVRNGEVFTIDNSAFVAVSLVLFVAFLPLFSDILFGYRGIAPNLLIWMLFALAFNILLGYTGLLSFGHAMFLGGSMYIVAILMRTVSPAVFPFAAVVSIVIVGAVAFLIGRLIVQKGEIYFALLTIAFAEVFWYIGNANPLGLTGGDDGISRGLIPPLVDTHRGNMFIGIGGMEISIYWAVAIVFVFAVFGIYRIVRSPFGRTLATIRENEELARSIGIDTRRYKEVSFVLSAMFSALAGVMLVIVNQTVATDFLHWETSGQVVMMVIVGGIHSFVGPMFGAFLWLAGEDLLSGSTLLGGLRHYYHFFFGLLFVIVILLNPKGGGWGLVKQAITGIWTKFKR